MSQQGMDLRRSIKIIWRHKILVGVVIVLGIVVGGGYAKLNPPMLTSTALVVLPQNAQSAQAAASGVLNQYTATQELIAGGTQVLTDALPDVRPHNMSLAELRREIEIGSLTSYVISISAKGAVAANTEATANAVAHSYISFLDSANSPVGRVPANLFQSATSAAGLAPLETLIIYSLIGAVSGALIGAIISLAISRADRRLRERDEIANSIGVPVLASYPVARPGDAAEWTKLLDDYKPAVQHALQLRKVLRYLGTLLDDGGYADTDRSSVTVLAVSSDSGALALGPQLAAFAASQGIPTVLAIGPQQDPDATATLRVACAAQAPSSRSGPLQAVVLDDHIDVPQDAALTVVVVVVDGTSPRIPDTAHKTITTLLGVSSGGATAEQLARVAVGADANGREITGILVADPESTDHTTGRIPQVSRPARRRMPTRLKGISTEIRR